MITSQDVILAAAARDIYLANSGRQIDLLVNECNSLPGDPFVNLGWQMDVLENEMAGAE